MSLPGELWPSAISKPPVLDPVYGSSVVSWDLWSAWVCARPFWQVGSSRLRVGFVYRCAREQLDEFRHISCPQELWNEITRARSKGVVEPATNAASFLKAMLSSCTNCFDFRDSAPHFDYFLLPSHGHIHFRRLSEANKALLAAVSSETVKEPWHKTWSLEGRRINKKNI